MNFIHASKILYNFPFFISPCFYFLNSFLSVIMSDKKDLGSLELTIKKTLPVVIPVTIS